MTYIPQPGTIPARVLAHLKDLPPRTELMSSVLLDAIGQPPEFEGFTSCMRACVDAGLIIKRLEGRRAFWRLPTAPEDLIKAQPPLGNIEQQVTLQDHTAIDDAEPDNRPRASKTPTRKVAKAQAERQAEPDAFACGLFSDGRLVLEMPERTVLLKPEWTSKLMAFLRTAPGVSA